MVAASNRTQLTFKIFVDDPIVRSAIIYEDFSADTLEKYLGLVTEATKLKVTKALPKKFGIIIEGWSDGNKQYIAVYAAYESDEFPLLAFAPPFDKESYTVES